MNDEVGTLVIRLHLSVPDERYNSRGKMLVVCTRHNVTRAEAKDTLARYESLNDEFKGNLTGQWTYSELI